jgi:ubiquinone/menaquinone biosynthesis C-methylase UbiE
LPYPDSYFDVVASCNVLHYSPHPVRAIEEMMRVLRAGGRLVLTNLCRDFLVCRLYDWCLRLFSPAHVKVYSQREMKELLERSGCPGAEPACYKVLQLWGR